MSMIRSFIFWYWRGIKSAPIFSAGYVVGGIVVGFLTQAPLIASAVVRLVP